MRMKAKILLERKVPNMPLAGKTQPMVRSESKMLPKTYSKIFEDSLDRAGRVVVGKVVGQTSLPPSLA